MRHLGRVALVIAALAALQVLAGASASATVLCKGVPNGSGVCSTKDGAYAKTQVFKASTKSALFTLHEGGAKEIVCESEIEVEQTSASGAEVSATLISLKFTSCVIPGDPPINCMGATTEGTGMPANAGFKATDDSGNGILTVTGEPKVAMNCPNVACVFSFKNAQLSVLGGKPGIFKALEVTLGTSTKMFYTECPKAVALDATYTLFSPLALWVGTSID